MQAPLLSEEHCFVDIFPQLFGPNTGHNQITDAFPGYMTLGQLGLITGITGQENCFKAAGIIFGLDSNSILSTEANMFVGCNHDLFMQEIQNIQNTTAPWIKMDGPGNEIEAGDDVIAANQMMPVEKKTDQMTRAAANTPTNGIKMTAADEMEAGIEMSGGNDSDSDNVFGNGNEKMIPGGMIGKTVHPSDIVTRNDIPAQNEMVAQSKTVKPCVTLVRSKTFIPSENFTGDQIGTVIQLPNLKLKSKSVSQKGSVQEVKRSLSTIVKKEALSLVGAECHPMFHRENRKNQVKRGTMIVLPESGDIERVDESGKILYSPNWGKAATHPYNYRFIEAVISAVSALPEVEKEGYSRELVERAAKTYFLRMRNIFNTQRREDKENDIQGGCGSNIV